MYIIHCDYISLYIYIYCIYISLVVVSGVERAPGGHLGGGFVPRSALRPRQAALEARRRGELCGGPLFRHLEAFTSGDKVAKG